MHIDRIDILIINSLMEDGRKSFRQVSRETKVSAPTVEQRFNRMKKLGIIKGIEPIFDIEKIEDIISALVYLQVSPTSLTNIIDNLSLISEIKSIFTITGKYNIVIKIVAKDLSQLNEIVNNRIYSISGIISISSQIITQIIKDEIGFTLKEGHSLKARCIYCYNDIKNHTRTIRINNSEKYFCCNSCLTLYQKKHGELDTIAK
ncbi:MAG: Lrp/AsnC ligand binding domain-containing protein [Candidatus Nitrosocosmicus sp.]